MAIITHDVVIGGVLYRHTYTDNGHRITDGVKEYDDSLDLAAEGKTFEESLNLIEDELEGQDLLDIILGGDGK